MAGWEDGREQWEVAESEGADTSGGASGKEDQVKRIRKWEACKPWRGARCVLYHEHGETDKCGDVFLGR